MRAILCTSLLGTVTFCVQAQPSIPAERGVLLAQALTPRPTVTKAQDFIESPLSRVGFDKPLTFKRKTSPAAQRALGGRFQIRVFTIAEAGNLPDSLTPNDDCDSYVTLVQPITPAPDGTIVFGTTGVEFLGLTRSESSVKEGHYLFVFERIEDPEQQSNKVFRIRRTDARAYFDTGFEVTVHNDEMKARIEDVTAAYARRVALQDRLSKVLFDSTKPPCYTYLRATSERPEPELIVELDIAACQRAETS